MQFSYIWVETFSELLNEYPADGLHWNQVQIKETKFVNSIRYESLMKISIIRLRNSYFQHFPQKISRRFDVWTKKRNFLRVVWCSYFVFTIFKFVYPSDSPPRRYVSMSSLVITAENLNLISLQKEATPKYFFNSSFANTFYLIFAGKYSYRSINPCSVAYWNLFK